MIIVPVDAQLGSVILVSTGRFCHITVPVIETKLAPAIVVMLLLLATMKSPCISSIHGISMTAGASVAITIVPVYVLQLASGVMSA